ncbi:hypothetical protein AB0392_16125 [Nonomuraea angiospora]|uniref:hypothetical protein n=1 Tax=Nonomuraea angiospora TaxID=46172 RepID=UPI0034505E4B
MSCGELGDGELAAERDGVLWEECPLVGQEAPEALRTVRPLTPSCSPIRAEAAATWPRTLAQSASRR